MKKKGVGKKPKLKKIYGQPSWRVASDKVEVHVTRSGGHMAPVTFDRKKAKIKPYSVAPWHREKMPKKTPAVLKVLRGDFFCMPFGGNEKHYRGESHPAHGETANSAWSLRSLGKSSGIFTLHLRMNTKTRRGCVDKYIRLIDGHNAIYCRHVISGMKGAMSFGHHPTLKCPESGGIISTSPIAFGQVFPGRLERPELGGYSILKPGARFKSLKSVRRYDGICDDISRYPARRGYEDIVLLASKRKSRRERFGWSAVSFPDERYVWFSLKDPMFLQSTLLWFSNGGRHYAPWNGRHTAVLGVEDVTSYFHTGLAESARRNPLSNKGVSTTFKMRTEREFIVNHIQAAVPVPKGFGEVQTIERADDGKSVTLVCSARKKVKVDIDTRWLLGEED